MPAHDALLEEIAALLAVQGDDGAPDLLARLEHTLTVGYAKALALEGERWRLERRLGQQALAGGEAAELTRLAQEMSSTDATLAELRDVLSTLRAHADAVRASAAAA